MPSTPCHWPASPHDGVQQPAPAVQPDSLASLLSLLASVYGMHPGKEWCVSLLGASCVLPHLLFCISFPLTPCHPACTATCTADLFLEESLRYDAFGAFMEGVASSGAISASPSAFQAYLEVLTALAAGERGARSMYLQASLSMARCRAGRLVWD